MFLGSLRAPFNTEAWSSPPAPTDKAERRKFVRLLFTAFRPRNPVAAALAVRSANPPGMPPWT